MERFILQESVLLDFPIDNGLFLKSSWRLSIITGYIG
jgi:hypothetical protein